MRGQIWPVVWADIRALETVGEAAAIVDIAGEPASHGQLCGEAGVQSVALIVVDRDVVGAFGAGIVVGVAAGEAAGDAAALLSDLIGIRKVEMAEVGELRRTDGKLP